MSVVKRDNRIDGIKFLLICLVIIGHYIEPSRYKNDISGTLYSLIYILHMPLFVMISGYFCGIQKLSKLSIFSIKMIEVIAIIIGISYLFINSNIESPFIFSTPLWFILSLIYWKWYSYCLDRLNVSTGFQVIISFSIALLGFVFVNNDQEFLSLSRALQFLPYFSLGRWVKNKKISFDNRLSILLLLVISVITVLLSSRALHLFEFQREGLFSLVSKTKLPIYLCFTYKILLWMVTASASIVALYTIKMPTIFEEYGKYTLSIFCFHCYSYPFVVKYFHTLDWELILSILSIIVFILIARNELLSKFITNPLSLIIGGVRNNIKKIVR